MTPSESRATDQVVRVCCRCSSKPAQKVPRSFQLFTTVQRWRQRFDFEWLRSLPRIYHNIKYTWNKIMFLTAFISICLRCADVWAAQIEQVCVQPRPSAVDMTLPVFTAEFRGSVLWRRCYWAPTPAVDRYLLSAAGALSSKPAVRTRSMGQTDGRTDRQTTLDHFIHRFLDRILCGAVSVKLLLQEASLFRVRCANSLMVHIHCSCLQAVFLLVLL